VVGGPEPECIEMAKALRGRGFDTFEPVGCAEAREFTTVYKNTIQMLNAIQHWVMAQPRDAHALTDGREGRHPLKQLIGIYFEARDGQQIFLSLAY
jgi:hypothetical protein